MVPSTEHIMKRRHHNCRRLRFSALVLVTIAAVIMSMWLAQAAINWDFDDWQRPLWMSAGFVMPAMLLWLFDRPLSRLLVPLPRPRCPKCGYNLVALTRPACPECGIDIPAVFVATAAPAEV